MSIQNFTYFNGNTIPFDIVITDSDNNPQDITGWTIFFTLKTDINDPDTSAIIAKTATITDPTAGEANLVIANTETSGLVGAYYYDMQTKDDNGYITTIMDGTIEFVQRVTLRTT